MIPGRDEFRPNRAEKAFAVVGSQKAKNSLYSYSANDLRSINLNRGMIADIQAVGLPHHTRLPANDGSHKDAFLDQRPGFND